MTRRLLIPASDLSICDHHAIVAKHQQDNVVVDTQIGLLVSQGNDIFWRHLGASLRMLLNGRAHVPSMSASLRCTKIRLSIMQLFDGST